MVQIYNDLILSASTGIKNRKQIMKHSIQKSVFIAAILVCLTPLIDPPAALLLGFSAAMTIGHPFIHLNSKATNWLLKASIVGLGFGVNLHHAAEAGKDGFLFTLFSITSALITGMLFGKLFKVGKRTSFLISSGTAICGGSAIAAVAPIIEADEKEISIALGTVFILNSAALFIFPASGHFLEMSQHQFGLWSAIAIHDTSSVVGAASRFGDEALRIATTVKLERALWIIPLSVMTVFFVKGDSRKIKIPYFIFLYIAAMCISTFIPDFNAQYNSITAAAKKGLTVTLFLIGSGLSPEALKSVGIKPLLQGIALWMAITAISLTAVMSI